MPTKKNDEVMERVEKSISEFYEAMRVREEQLAQSAASPQHGGKVAADEKKERHAKAMNGHHQATIERRILMQVLRRPPGQEK